MRGLDRKAACAFLATSCPLLLVLAPSSAPAAAEETWRVHIGDTLTADAVRTALHGAAQRLRSQRCAEVFSSPDLLDGKGRTLQETLTELRTDAATHLAGLSFYEGSSGRSCRRGDVLAFTTVGAGHVFICGPRFRAAWKKSPYLVEQTLIHEMLHTLGLGENPPSSTVITNVVRSYCDHVTRAAEESR